MSKEQIQYVMRNRMFVLPSWRYDGLELLELVELSLPVCGSEYIRNASAADCNNFSKQGSSDQVGLG